MKRRFGLSFHLHDGASLGNALKSALDGGFLPDSAIWAVASLQLLRVEKHMGLLQKINASREMPLWSMLVFSGAL